MTRTYRETDAYPCAYMGCTEQGIGVETRSVQPNGMAASLGFYGFCAEHDPRVTCCAHCGRVIVLAGDVWVDPEGSGDDIVWRETCDAHDTFIADHEPVSA